MTEQTPQDISEWHNGKRTRVGNVDKAQLMAQAVKHYEDESAALRFVTEKTMLRPGYSPQDGRIDYGDFEQELVHGEFSEDPKSLHADRMEALDDLDNDERRQGALLPSDAPIDRIKRNNEKSDEVAEIVADTYDKLEATKR